MLSRSADIILSFSNNEFCYNVNITEITDENGLPVNTYGITITDGTKTLSSVYDLTDDLEKITDFCRLLCTEKGLPEHLWELAEDFICE